MALESLDYGQYTTQSDVYVCVIFSFTAIYLCKKIDWIFFDSGIVNCLRNLASRIWHVLQLMVLGTAEDKLWMKTAGVTYHFNWQSTNLY